MALVNLWDTKSLQRSQVLLAHGIVQIDFLLFINSHYGRNSMHNNWQMILNLRVAQDGSLDQISHIFSNKWLLIYI